MGGQLLFSFLDTELSKLNSQGLETEHGDEVYIASYEGNKTSIPPPPLYFLSFSKYTKYTLRIPLWKLVKFDFFRPAVLHQSRPKTTRK